MTIAEIPPFFTRPGLVAVLFHRWLTELRSEKQFQNFVRDSPLDAVRFETYLAAALAGSQEEPPTMVTPRGRELCLVVRMYALSRGVV